MYFFGDIVIINFPFAEGSGSKRRPVMVLKDTGDGDLLVAKVTSQLYATEYDVSLQNWQKANLISNSVVRTHKIQTVSTRIIFGHIGRLTSGDRQLVKNAVVALFEST